VIYYCGVYVFIAYGVHFKGINPAHQLFNSTLKKFFRRAGMAKIIFKNIPDFAYVLNHLPLMQISVMKFKASFNDPG